MCAGDQIVSTGPKMFHFLEKKKWLYIKVGHYSE